MMDSCCKYGTPVTCTNGPFSLARTGVTMMETMYQFALGVTPNGIMYTSMSWVDKIFMTKGHTCYFGLLRGTACGKNNRK